MGNESRTDPPVPPSPDLLRRGPPDPAVDPARAKLEKWCQVEIVVPTPLLAIGTLVRHSFERRGPLTIPMAVRREGAALGRSDAWIFFTHPPATLPQGACFWNAAPGRAGVLEARLARPSMAGFQLYDEVGAVKDAEPVTASLAEAMGTLRERTLGRGPRELYASDLLRLEVDLLEAFRVLTLCTRTDSGVNALAEIAGMLQRKNVAPFLRSAFGEEDLKTIESAVKARDDGSFRSDTRRFRVDRGDFTRPIDIADGQGRKVVAELKADWDKLVREHGPSIQQLEEEIAACVEEDERLRKERASPTGFARLLGRGRATRKIDLRRVAVAAKQGELRAALDAIPGYGRLHGVATALEEFEKVVRGVERLATNIFDANVSQRTVGGLGKLVDAFEDAATEKEKAEAYRRYRSQLHAEVLPRLFSAYSISAYVLRRPDSVSDRGRTRANMLRICRLAEDLIGYFRAEPYGGKTLGVTFDETWAQVRTLEARALA